MLYMVLCRDKEDSLALRMATRAEHLDYIAGAGARVKYAGPILSYGDDPKPIGTLIMIDAASETAVQLFADNDPYKTAGLFESIEIRPWRAVTGDWLPENAAT